MDYKTTLAKWFMSSSIKARAKSSGCTYDIIDLDDLKEKLFKRKCDICGNPSLTRTWKYSGYEFKYSGVNPDIKDAGFSKFNLKTMCESCSSKKRGRPKGSVSSKKTISTTELDDILNRAYASDIVEIQYTISNGDIKFKI